MKPNPTPATIIYLAILPPTLLTNKPIQKLILINISNNIQLYSFLPNCY